VGRGEKAARLAAASIERTLQEARGQEIPALLQQALRRAQRLLWREGEKDGVPGALVASATVAVMLNRRLYVAHVGSTGAFLVRGAQVIPLTQPDVSNAGPDARLTRALGLHAQLQEDGEVTPGNTLAPDGASIPLQRGDHVVLYSDGLLQPRPDRGGPLLDPATEMAPVLNNPNTPALEAARTLVSLAVGRRAADNVSVVVVSMPPRSGAEIPKALLALAAVVLVAIIFVTILLLRESNTAGNPPAAAPTAVALAPTTVATTDPVDQGDFFVGPVHGPGQVFFTDGTSLAQGNQIRLAERADATVRTEPETTASFNLNDGTGLFLGPESELRFVQIDLENDPGRTVLALRRGDLLLVRAAAGDRLDVIDGQGELLATLSGNGTLLVSNRDRLAEAACIHGACNIVTTEMAVSEDLLSLWQERCRCLPP
jgi:serine/threonine protein phosphatase PrpC